MFGRILPLVFLVAVGTASAQSAEEWQEAVAKALGRQGAQAPGGVYRVGLPRTDLKVTLNGTELKPGFAFGSWLAFKKNGDHVMAMGDLVLLDSEINPVMSRLRAAGIEVTALHNHLLHSTPHTMYMHVRGTGEPGKLASDLRAALSASATPLASPAASASAAQPAIDFDTNAVDAALGQKGKVNGGVYQFSVPRAEPVRDEDMEVPEAMGSAIAINFQPTGNGKAAITGDFVLTAAEVNPVLSALRDSGIEVTAIHNHMLHDTPRLFFMHFWANDDAVKLARGLRAALDKTAIKKG